MEDYPFLPTNESFNNLTQNLAHLIFLILKYKKDTCKYQSLEREIDQLHLINSLHGKAVAVM